MQFKDLSFWGIFKISLIVEHLITVLLMPLMLIGHFVMPEKINFDITSKWKIGFLTADTDGLIGALVIIPLLFFTICIGAIVKAAVLHFIAQKTRLGRIKISKDVSVQEVFT
ncbi:hypothetical protein AB8615_07875 [Litorimonas sp. RW-G-Af-16]|uniref:hypothetical protein n=1 Tax=Litorimonas sp. RW-G-Af-16 TaxID=3241168 RepID=UPI003AAC2D59